MPLFQVLNPLVEAVKWSEPGGGLVGGCPDWIKQGMDKEEGKDGSILRYGNNVHVYDDRGYIRVCHPGDYLVKDDENRTIWVCSGKIFERLYGTPNLLNVE